MEKTIHQERYRKLITLLRQNREMSGLTQSQLAELLNTSQTVVSKIESCERRLDVIELIEICKAIDIDFNNLMDELNSKII